MRNTTAPLTTIDNLPALKGRRLPDWDGRYRVYTVAHLPFDALGTRPDLGPATVLCTEWAVSTSRADDGMVALDLYRFTGEGPDAVMERHALDGTKYATYLDADRAAYEAGLLGFMVYEYDAPKYGLPTADDAEPAGRACTTARRSTAVQRTARRRRTCLAKHALVHARRVRGPYIVQLTHLLSGTHDRLAITGHVGTPTRPRIEGVWLKGRADAPLCRGEIDLLAQTGPMWAHRYQRPTARVKRQVAEFLASGQCKREYDGLDAADC